MRWLEISVKINNRFIDLVSEILTRFGANGVSINDSSNFDKDFEGINWDYIDESLISNDNSADISAYYPEGSDEKDLLKQIEDALKEAGKYLKIEEYSLEKKYVDEENWQEEWKKYYKPIRIGESIIIKPSWESVQANEEDIIVELDPGMAFGTGTHESTQMCMEFLEKYIKNGNKLLDIGCGSGILSILGAKLGCSKVFAIDIDDLAVKTSKENIKLNNVEKIVSVRKAVIDELPDEKYTIVTANIVADVIMDIAEKAGKFLDKGGLFITSGIIADRKDEVIQTILSNGFEITEISIMGEWVAIVSLCASSL